MTRLRLPGTQRSASVTYNRALVAPAALASDSRTRSPARCATPVGMLTVNVVPSCSLLATFSVPPCILTSSLTRASPMPEPSCVRARVPCTR